MNLLKLKQTQSRDPSDGREAPMDVSWAPLPSQAWSWGTLDFFAGTNKCSFLLKPGCADFCHFKPERVLANTEIQFLYFQVGYDI